jgi:hypothetical protein
VNSCARCGRQRLLVALHGDAGGPDVCLDCSAEMLSRARASAKKDRELLRRLASGCRFAQEEELDAELLEQVIRLVHPDLHAPARKEAATKAAARLTALRPHVAPPCPPEPLSYGSVDGLRGAVRETVTTDLFANRHPCEICYHLLPDFYCDKCRERWKADRRKELDRENARRRELRARRRAWTQPVSCARCEETFVPTRSDSRYCSNACRQRAYRQRQTGSQPEAFRKSEIANRKPETAPYKEIPVSGITGNAPEANRKSDKARRTPPLRLLGRGRDGYLSGPNGAPAIKGRNG